MLEIYLNTLDQNLSKSHNVIFIAYRLKVIICLQIPAYIWEVTMKCPTKHINRVWIMWWHIILFSEMQMRNHFCLEFNFPSNFEPSQGFRSKKSEPTQGLGTWSRFRRENKEKLNASNFEPSQSYACTESRVIVSFDDFLSHLRYPPYTDRIIEKCSLYLHLKLPTSLKYQV